jgi:glutamine amidotransferase
MIGIVDYGMGNLHSVYSAFSFLGTEVKMCCSPNELDKVDKIVIPGVGAFKDCMDSLEKHKLIASLERNVITRRKPTLGICLGMQIMAMKGYEGGAHNGLGWFDAEIILLKPTGKNRVPNIGWVEINYKKNKGNDVI